MSGDDNGRPIVGGVKWAELQAPWPEYCHKHRTAEDGKRLKYVGWRTIQGRLDACCGQFGWGVQVFVDAQHGVVTATITIHDGQRTITRSDAAGIEGVPLATGWEDSVKIGVTEACKRAAGQFGIGRELYEEAVEGQPVATSVGVAPASAVGTTGDGKPVPSTGDIADVLAETQGVEHDHTASPVDPPQAEKVDTATVAAAAITPAIGSTVACPKCAREFGSPARPPTVAGSAIGAGG